MKMEEILAKLTQLKMDQDKILRYLNINSATIDSDDHGLDVADANSSAMAFTATSTTVRNVTDANSSIVTGCDGARGTIQMWRIFPPPPPFSTV